MELEASLRRYNESLRYYTTSALKEAEELTKAANLQLQQSGNGHCRIHTVRDDGTGHPARVYRNRLSV